jgi:hypothetical protein
MVYFPEDLVFWRGRVRVRIWGLRVPENGLIIYKLDMSGRDNVWSDANTLLGRWDGQHSCYVLRIGTCQELRVGRVRYNAAS